MQVVVWNGRPHAVMGGLFFCAKIDLLSAVLPAIILPCAARCRKGKQQVKKIIGYGVFVLSVLLLCGCSPVRLKIVHDPLQRLESKKHGNIFVRQFTDKRAEPLFIGDIRNRFGLEIGRILSDGDVKLAALVTTYFAEALNAAGYSTIIQESRLATMAAPSGCDAVIEGEILVFWMDLHERIRQSIEIRTRALDPTGKTVLWSRVVKADRSNGIWWGTQDEYERVLNETLTQALNEAAKEFASEAFFKTVNQQAKGGS